LNFQEIKTTCEIIQLLGGLKHISNFLDGDKQSVKDCARKMIPINQYGGSLRYDFWNLLELMEAERIESNLKSHDFTYIFLALNDYLIPPLNGIVFDYYQNHAKSPVIHDGDG
jgi:hypothetical protein